MDVNCKDSFKNRRVVAFTLVEIVVVITILVIFGGIAFVSFGGFQSKARDAKRSSDIRNLINKIEAECIIGASYEELIDSGGGEIKNKRDVATSGKGCYNEVISNQTVKICQGPVNFDNMRESRDNFLDPLSTTDNKIDYVFAYTAPVVTVDTNGKKNGKEYVQGGIVNENYMAIVYGNYYSKNKSLKELGTLQLSSKDDASVLQGNPKGLILGKYIEPLINGESIVSSIYGDEGELEKDVCNEWVKQAIGNKAGGYENWIWVPATHFVTDGYGIGLDDLFYYREVIYQGTPYVCKGFAVMKFEAKHLNGGCINVVTGDDDYCSNLNGNVGSTPAPLPLTALTQGEAIHACKGLTYGNATSHLITNNEYMTLARNIEQQANNWSSGVVGEGYIYKGNDDGQPGILAVSNINDGYDGTGDGENIQDSGIYNGSTMSSKGQRRTLYLSNGVAIWDLSGNVREHVNKSNVPTTSNNRVANSGWNNETFRTESVCLDPTGDMRQGRNDPPPARKWYRFSFSGDDSELGGTLDGNNDGAYGGTCNWQNGYSYSSFGPGISGLNATNGIGRIWAKWYAHRDHIIMVRGGHRSKKALGGLYSTGLDYSASSKESSVGFRCAL